MTEEEILDKDIFMICESLNEDALSELSDELPIWKTYGEFNTIHCLKTLKNMEGKGIGRSLLSILMRQLKNEDYPIYLHTHPVAFRAIKR